MQVIRLIFKKIIIFILWLSDDFNKYLREINNLHIYKYSLKINLRKSIEHIQKISTPISLNYNE